MKRLRAGVIGVGHLGQHHARHLAKLDEVRLVGVCDTDAGRAAKVAAELGTTAFVDMDDLLARAEAVTIAVPTPVHAEVGLRALELGIPVLMEKPLAATLDEADRLISSARRQRLQLQVGHIERYNRALRAAEPYLDGPRYIESQRLAPFQAFMVEGAPVSMARPLRGGRVTHPRVLHDVTCPGRLGWLGEPWRSDPRAARLRELGTEPH